MTHPAQSRWCEHCKSRAAGKRITTGVAGAAPVVVTLCRCDYLTCGSCGVTVYDRHARRCASCGRDPAVKAA